MPFTGNEQLPKGVKSLAPEQQSKWRKVFNSAYEGTCKDRENRDECASKIAWSQVSKSYVEFSMVITKASRDPATGEMRWSAVASDTDKDSYGESMTLRLFNNFIKRAGAKENPPVEHCSEFWCGGMPYLSVAHYRDMNGEAVPGEVRKLYVDGNRFKSSGVFFDTPLGNACFKASYESKDLPDDEKVRISIGFLDYEHAHGDAVFRRKNLNDVCPMCVAGAGNKQYLDGLLIHEAMTRVPVNKRTIIEAEVERSMDEIKTRQDDAASIVGEELAAELEQKAAASVQKSEVSEPELVIKAEAKDDMEECEDDDEECKKRMKDKKQKMMEEKKSSAEADVEKMDMGMDMPFGGASSWEEYDSYVEHQEASRAMYDSWYTMEMLAQNAMMMQPDDMKKRMSELLKGCHKRMEVKSLIALSKLESFDPAALVVKSEAPAPHPLDVEIAELKFAFDEIVKSDSPATDKLQAIQPVFAKLGEAVRARVEMSEVKQVTPEVLTATPDPMLQSLADSIRSLKEEVSMLTSQLSARSGVQQVQRPTQPPHRNLGANAQVVKSLQSITAEKPNSLRAQIRKSVGLQY